jgi:pyruvate dehydrogenase E1 component
MEGLFRQLAIYSSVGQLYEPEDKTQLMYYREDKHGQILEQGINEAGAFAAWMAAATAYSNHGVPMIPFYIYYSMFGFQRIGDLSYAAGDAQARGFLIGATAGRTTLSGEGLQHQDGHSHIIASTIPNCVAYDPTYAYELAVIIQDGMRRMYQDRESLYYYITTMNESYAQPPLPQGAEEGILKGMYRLREVSGQPQGARVRLLGSGAILREVEAAAELLAADFGVTSEIWSVTSFIQLRRQGIAVDRWNLLHPEARPRRAYVTECLQASTAPVVAATDYLRAYADEIRAWVSAPYSVLGTDGFGRSDTRRQLRRFFEVDRHFVALAALAALAKEGAVPRATVHEAIQRYGIDPESPDPVTL